MKTWVINATIGSSDWATPAALESKQAEIEAAGGRSARVTLDEERGAVEISFEVDANDVDAAVIEGHNVMNQVASAYSWGVSGATYWLP